MASTFFLIAGVFYLALGWKLGAPGVPIAWLGLSLFVIGVAYVARAPQLLGKRQDGTFHTLALLIHAPFLVATWLAWQLRRRRGEAVWNEVAPGIFVGRMATREELPPATGLVIDLTCELVPPRAVRSGRYECLPTLDGTAPRANELSRLAASEGVIFVHCAAGHGRSATLAAAIVLARGLATSVEEAERQLKLARPRIGLSGEQRLLLARLYGQALPQRT